MVLLKRLELKNFRIFPALSLEFKPGINAIIGRNALGKTSILEGIHLFSTGRSFRTTRLTDLIRQGATSAFLKVTFEKDGVEQTLSLEFNKEERKIFHNHTRYPYFSSLLGLLPSSIYAPSDISLISGTPSMRRRFLDISLSQKDPSYLSHLVRYNKALLQRNALLKKEETLTLDIWEEEMVKEALPLIEKRQKAVKQLEQLAQKHYKHFIKEEESIALLYEKSVEGKDLGARLAENRKKEFLLGHTLHGPHRDDISFYIQSTLAKSYASEGQKRSLIAALRLAECEELDAPLFLIDDFGMHLDDSRKENFTLLLKSERQTLLTSPTPLSMPFHFHEISLSY